MDTNTSTETSCSTSGCGGLNYCRIAKKLVAVPAIPILAALAASFATTPEWQFTIAAYTGALVVLIAQKIDHLKALKPMLRKKKLTT